MIYRLLTRIVGRIRYGFAEFGFGSSIRAGTEVLNGYRIKIGKDVTIGRYALLDAKNYMGGEITVGDRTIIDDFARLMCFGGKIEIGSDCSVNPYCMLYGNGNLKIGDMVRIASHTIIIPANHGFDRVDIPIILQSETKKGIIIEDNVWIGSGSIILDGVTIGTGAVVGAGSVVTKNVPPYHIVAGVPAITIRKRE